MGTNELDHLRKVGRGSDNRCTSGESSDHGEPAGPVASARATLYLAEVIRSGLESMVWSDVKQDVVKSGPVAGLEAGDCRNSQSTTMLQGNEHAEF